MVKADDKILLVWGSNSTPLGLENQVNLLRQKVGDKGLVQVEHETILLQCKFIFILNIMYFEVFFGFKFVE